MTDNEIIKALEYCFDSCNHSCPLYNYKDCKYRLLAGLLDLINRQKAEIDRLQNNLAISKKETKRYALRRAEAIKEFAERAKRYIDVGHLRPPTEICFSELDVVSIIDALAKETVGGNDG